MKFIFWQNIVSIHQSAFIKALAIEHDVTLVAQEEIDAQRAKERWTIPSMGNAKVVLDPDNETIDKFLDTREVEHVFSGINAFPMVHKAFKGAVKRKLKVSVMAEPYEWSGVKGWLRQIMYRLLFIRYGRNIKHLFATGDMGVRCYRKSGFPMNKLHQWGYFTEQKVESDTEEGIRTKPNLIFIGKIDDNKNILSLAKYAVQLSDSFNRFTIIGTGILESELRKMISKTNNIEFIGPVANYEIPYYLRQSDLLILPSLYDGWGAVVNEALSQGVRVFCSDRCGAASTIDGEERGGVFRISTKTDFESQLRFWISKGVLKPTERKSISDWATQHLSGTAASKYFCNVMAGKNVLAPWINKQ